MPQSLEGDLALLGAYDPRRHDVALSSGRRATQPAPATCSRLPAGPGLGTSLRRVRLSAIHDRRRGPRGHDVLSSCRLGKGTQESAGKRYGTAGAKLGNASRQWACSEAAVLLLRDNPAGPQSLTKLEHTHGQGQALPLLAQKLARAVADMLTRHTTFELPQVLQV